MLNVVGEQPQKTCLHCGNTFIKPARRSNEGWAKRKFCGLRCSDRFRSLTMEERHCRNCGQPHLRRPGETNSQYLRRRFCGQVCYDQWRCRNHWDKKEETIAMNGVDTPVETFESMTTEELSLLQEYEEIIESSKRRAGKAFEAIRDQRLYRGTHKTWGAYLKERHKVSEHAVHDWINLSRLQDHLESVLPDVDSNISIKAARILRQLPPESTAGVWSNAVEENGGKTPTVTQVRDAVYKHLGKPTGRRPDGQIVEDWKEGRFGGKSPGVYIALTEDEATALARVADTLGVRAPDLARRLVNKGLRFYEEFDAAT